MAKTPPYRGLAGDPNSFVLALFGRPETCRTVVILAYASQFIIIRAYLWYRTSSSLLIRIGVVVIDELGLLLTRYLAGSVDPLYILAIPLRCCVPFSPLYES